VAAARFHHETLPDPLIAFVLAPACDSAYVGPAAGGDGGSAVNSAVPHAREQSAMENWTKALPTSLRPAVAGYEVALHRVTLYVNGDTATRRRSNVRRLCRRLAHTRIARRVILDAEAFENAHQLASIKAGGTCHTHRRYS
jgi:hypothetical protein